MTWDQLAAEIAQAIGKNPEEIPRLGTPEFNQLFGLLLESHPDLATRVQAWLVQSTEQVPSQSEIAAEARKSEARRRLASLFTKPDHTQPHRRRINKPVILAAIGAAMVVLWLVGRLHSSPMAVPETHGMQPRTAATHSALPPRQPPAQNEPARGMSRRSVGVSSVINAHSGPSSMPSGLPTPPLPLPPGPGLAPPPIQPASTGTAIIGPQSTQAQVGVQVIAGDASQPAGVTVVAGTASGSLTGSAAPAASAVIVSPRQGPSEASTTRPTSSAASRSGDASQVPRFQIGDQFTAKLLTPIAVSPAWQALPAVSQAVDGPISGWQLVGSASQGQDGSLQIAWTQAISPDRKTTIPLHGVAYDPKVGKPGVPQATSSVMAPQAARTVLSGALGGVSQYVQDQIQAQQTQVSGLTATITSQVPPFWQILAGQLATGFQPAAVQTGGTTLVSKVPAGTSVVVFITALVDRAASSAPVRGRGAPS